MAARAAPEEWLVRLLSAAIIIFFQAYVVAPLIPWLAGAFQTTEQTLGLVVPAYLIPHGVATLFYGVLKPRQKESWCGRRDLKPTQSPAARIRHSMAKRWNQVDDVPTVRHPPADIPVSPLP